MADSSSDVLALETVLRALREAKLEALVVGATAAVLQDAPVMTADVDMLIRDTSRNRTKLVEFCRLLGDARTVRLSEMASVLRVFGGPVPIDVLFDEISGPLTFESLKSRAIRVAIGKEVALVASLEDVIRSKEAAGRPKDLAALPALRETLAVKHSVAGGS